MDEEDSVLDFNFWPSFSDMMLSLVLILILVLVLVLFVFVKDRGTVDLHIVEDNQMNMVAAIAKAIGIQDYKKPVHKDTIELNNRIGTIVYHVMIKNEPTLQKLSFSDNVLFPQDKYDLNDQGEKVLGKVGDILKLQISNKFIREIQIQGHADTDQTNEYNTFGKTFGNLQLASFRAMRVFTFFSEKVKIEPVKILMSATSFGEYKPVQRSEEDTEYNLDRLKMDNKTDDLKAKNRRIELLLFYSLEKIKE